MATLSVFNSISLDGYFADASGEMNFAHNPAPDPEWDAFVSGNASGGGRLLFGRVTYQLMESFWPTPLAAAQMPVVAERMNNMPKVVFSRTMDKPAWKNTTLVKSDLAGAVRSLKDGPGDDMVILGSGSIVAQLAPLGLIDQYQLVLVPVVLGKGRTLFAGLPASLPLQRVNARTFDNGNVVLTYVQAGGAVHPG